MSNHEHLLNMFDLAKDYNTYSMCSHEHDFMRYGALRDFFGYTNKDFMVNNRYLDQIVFREDYYDPMDGRYHGYNFPPQLEGKNMSYKIAHYPSLTEVQVPFNDEMQEKVENISQGIWEWDAFDPNLPGRHVRPVIRSLDNCLVQCNANEYPQKLYDFLLNKDFWNPKWIPGPRYDQGDTYRAPRFIAANFHELLRSIQIAEVFSELNSRSPAELYYKVDIRNNVLLKNNAAFAIQDILNYENYVDLEEEESPFGDKQLKKQKLLAVLYKTQEARELFYADVSNAPMKHYTEKEFATLFANAALNTGYAISKGHPCIEELYTILGCTDANSRSSLELESKRFMLGCETLREMEDYINLVLVDHPEVAKMRENIDRARGSTLNEYLGSLFKQYLFIQIPKRN